MIPVRGHEGCSVGVFGMGRSGLAVARALKAGGAVPICWDDAEQGRAAAEEAGFALADLSNPKTAAGLTKLIVSPGAPHLFPTPHPAVSAALDAGIAVDNDIGLFLSEIARQLAATPDKARARAEILARQVPNNAERHDGLTGAAAHQPVLGASAEDLYETVRAISTPQTICITGSNGKSTTAALVRHVLQEAGRPSQLGGNIGVGVFDLEPPRAGEIFVLETSSYQTDLASSLACDVAVLTNLSPDHLDRHGGFGGYIAAKRRLLLESGARARIVGVDTMEARAILAQLAAGPQGRAALFGSGGSSRRTQFDGVYFREGRLEIYRAGALIGEIDLAGADALRGPHNAANAASAAQSCLALGLAPDVIERAFQSFTGLDHRMKTIAMRAGVRFVDDSKATNLDAAAKALGSFDRIRWIAGGRAKETDLTALAPYFRNVAKAYLIGEAAVPFGASLEALASAPPVVQCGALADAVAHAAAEATPGDVVLLAPACASFDQFRDFTERGRAFQMAVEALPPLG